ncbi:membrane protein [Geobacillus stearothermophilus ATCC 12980]|nr:membrane protein [Geobacillus stearothermophilus ATCC 12980]
MRGGFMLRKSWEFFILFNKEVFYNKIALLWTLVIPLFFMVFNHLSWLTNPPNFQSFKNNIFLYWSFMILITAISGVGISILMLRDNGFLKMFKFIARNKLPIILGKIGSQWFFVTINLVIFTAASALLFHQPVFSVLSIAIIVAIIVPLPIFFLFLWISSLPYRQETISPIFTILMFPLIYFANVEVNHKSLLVLNPASFILNVSKLISDAVSNHVWDITLSYTLVVIMGVYILIGVFSYKIIDITPKAGRI